MAKPFPLLTLLLALNLPTLRSTPVHSWENRHEHVSQAAPDRPDRTHTGSVAGIVADDKGGSVSGATVMLQDTVTRENPVSTTSNDKGQYKFTSLLPGEYEVWATKGNLESEHLQVKVANGTISAGNLILAKAGAHM